MMVEIATQNRCDEHGQQGEHGEDRLCRLTHITHVAISDEGDNRDAQQAVLYISLLLEVGCEACSSHNEHDDILNDGHTG